MLHAVKSTIGGGQQFFRSVAVGGVRSGAGAGGKSWRFGIGRHLFVDASHNARGDVGIGLWKDDGEFVVERIVGRKPISNAANSFLWLIKWWGYVP